jgi:hypothetical protein
VITLTYVDIGFYEKSRIGLFGRQQFLWEEEEDVMNSMNLLFSVFGGMIGAIFGPITTFIVVGFVGLAGVIATISGSTFDWIGLVALGPIFGPHVAFVGGVAAAAYAKKLVVLNQEKIL